MANIPPITLIIPVYNRPDEVEELFDSLSKQSDKDFEIIIVEDGSTQTCEPQIEKYKSLLSIKYFFKENTGPGNSRNYGIERADNRYTIFLDSDCVIPSQYIATVKKYLQSDYADCFGGPDSADHSFTTLQKSINYSMTSFLTTGGIRGGGEAIEKFNPRSFNMGFSREVFDKTGGFPSVRFAPAKAAGEDLELSLLIQKAGFKTRLYKDAYVYHKRRTNLKQFFRQVFNFGFARITVSNRNPGTLKIVHFAPTLFLIGTIICLLLSIIWNPIFIIPLLVYALLVFIDATIKNKSLVIGFYAILTSYIQLLGYGWGFLKSYIMQNIFNQTKFD